MRPQLETALYMEDRERFIVALQYMRALKILAAAGVDVKRLLPLDDPANAYYAAADLICVLLEGRGWDPAEDEAGEEPEYSDEFFIVAFPAPEEVEDDLEDAAADTSGTPSSASGGPAVTFSWLSTPATSTSRTWRTSPGSA